MNKKLTPGTRHRLKAVKKVDFGIYLAYDTGAPSADRVLLPASQMPEGISLGDEIDVFIYRDSSDRLIATVKTPIAALGEVARFEVSQLTRIGAFLSWGLEKDLFLPYAEQTYRIKEGDTVLAAIYLDKSDRLCATMNVYEYLKSDSPYIIGDEVTGIPYQDSERFGIFVAVDDKYQGLIPKRECYGDIKLGREVRARIVQVREDGKLDLSVRRKAYEQIGEDSEALLDLILSYDGVLPFTDKATPEVIKLHTGMSKNEFKRALGHLMKEGRVIKTETAIRMNPDC